MLEIRPSCEHCSKVLPVDSTEAMICTFECTFCKDCVEQIMQNVCPNCDGGFMQRPVRPKKHMEKYPARKDPVHEPIDMVDFVPLREKYKDVDPKDR